MPPSTELITASPSHRPWRACGIVAGAEAAAAALVLVGLIVGQRPSAEHVQLAALPRLLPLALLAMVAPVVSCATAPTDRLGQRAARTAVAAALLTGAVAAAVEAALARADTEVVFLTVLVLWWGAGTWAAATMLLAVREPRPPAHLDRPIVGVHTQISWAVAVVGLVPVTLSAAGALLRAGHLDHQLVVYVLTLTALSVPATGLVLRYLVRERDLAVAVPTTGTSEIGFLQRSAAASTCATGEDLSPRRHDVTALFFDLVGFTEYTNRYDPSTVLALLQAVFEIVTDEVEAAGGFVNKFVGDAALVVFGAPTPDPDRAVHAVRAACAIRDRLCDAHPGIGFGIGVASGPVVAGRVGGRERFEYTVIGAPVNRAERLQELTRDLEYPVVCDAVTAHAADLPAGTLDLLGRHHLRRSPTPVVVFGLARQRASMATRPMTPPLSSTIAAATGRRTPSIVTA